MREQIYLETCAFMDKWNQDHKDESFWLGPNTRFIDRLPSEIAKLQKVELVGDDETMLELPQFKSTGETLWETIDWRHDNLNPASVVAVTEIKNQGDCGACWSFSVLATVEAAVGIQYDILNDYSEQELIDCDSDNGGCDGGSFSSPLHYIQDNGISLYTDYPYEAVVGPCQSEEVKKAASIVSFVGVKSCDSSSMQAAIQEVGPLSVSIDASCETFMYYSGGLFDLGCGSLNNNHALAIVGFNTDPNNEFGANYWIAKNSWGTSWGVKGYMYLSMATTDSSSSGTCGISNVMKQPFGVYPNQSIALVNESYPEPKIDAEDDDRVCDHVEFFGMSLGGAKETTECSAVKWLAAPHSIVTWCIAFAITITFSLILSSCCRRLYRCCCGRSEDDRSDPPVKRRKRRRRGDGDTIVIQSHSDQHGDLQEVLIMEEDGGYIS